MNPIITPDGSKYWYNSERFYHREDGPAVENSNGEKNWYINGKLHREDGPAYESCDGSKAWFINGKRHREDGPAIEHSNGTKKWYINGQLHRDNGPAADHKDGTKYWWIKGIDITDEVNQWIIDNNFPQYQEWDDSIKVLFKLKFG